jgi:hypothetical protein
MQIHIVLALLCVTAGCGIFLGHVAGYKRAEDVGRRRLVKANDLHVRNVREIDAEVNGRILQAQKDSYFEGYHKARADVSGKYGGL